MGVKKLVNTIKPIPASVKTQEQEANLQGASNRLIGEAEIWRIVWGIKVRVQLVVGQPALIMPYFRLCTKNEPQNSTESKFAIRGALCLMARMGYKHEDLSPHQVGFYLVGGRSSCACTPFLLTSPA